MSDLSHTRPLDPGASPEPTADGNPFPAVHRGDLTIFHLQGNLNQHEWQRFTESVIAAMEACDRRIVLNLADLEMLQSTGVGAIVSLHHRAESLGGTLVITRLSEANRRVLAQCRLDEILSIVDAENGSAESATPKGRGQTLAEEIEESVRELCREGMPGVLESKDGNLPEPLVRYLRDLDHRGRRLDTANAVLRDLLAHSDLARQTSDSRYRALFNQIDDAVLVIQVDEAQVVEANSRAMDLVRLPASSLVGMRLSALLPDLARLDTPALVEALREQSGESTAASLLLTRGDGSTLPVQVTASTAPALGDEMLLVSLRDVSAFQVVEQRLRSQVYQLSRLNAIGRRLAAKHSVEAILSEMLLEGQRLLEPTEALVLRIDPDHQRATAAWIMEGESNGVQDHQHLQRRFSKPCERFSRLLSSAEPTKVGAEDLNPLAEVEILPREWLQRRRRWITQTIVASDRPVALVIMGRDANSPWKDQGLSLLNNLATMAGLSLDNAEHLTSVERAHTRWRHLFDSSRDAIGVVDLSTGRVVAANREWSILTAQSLDDASDAPFVDVLAEADWEQAQERLARLQETGQERWECRLNVWGEGEGVWVQVRASLVESGATPTALLILINITAQRQRDQEVRSLSRIAIANPNLVLKADESGEIIYANPGTSAFLRRAGMPPDKVAATLPESLEGLVRPLVANPGKVETFEHRVGDRTLLHTATATEDERTVIFHGVEITAQKHLEEAITESEENYRLLVEGAREGICAIRDGVFHTVNRALCAMLGRDADEVVGKPLREFMEPEDWPEIRQILVDWPHGAPKVRESAFRLHDAMGRVRDIHGAFVPDKVGDTPQLLGYLTDITEQRRLESQLLQKHRIESVGQLAKGIANEFNNSLCTILGNASQMAERLSGDAEAQRLLSAIERAADRGADLTHQLQTFTNSAQVDPQILDLSEEIKRCIDLVRGTIGADVRISFTPTAEPALVEIDPAQLNQVLVAIAANSREAMPRGGELQIRVCSFVLGTPEIERMPQGRMGPHHCLEVSDTGGGIPEDVLPKIFDPFFTTKSSGDGTGLGLALVHTIMERMGGFIDVESEVGVGTTMRLFMPRSDGSTEKSASSEGAVRSCGSLVLIVDDEDLVRELVAEVLQDAGFKVMTARNGAEGLAACEGLIDDLSAVVLDFIMPVMDGAETFKRLREIRPDLPILVASGFAGEQETGDMLSQGNADFLTKPFRREALLGKLDALIVARA